MKLTSIPGVLALALVACGGKAIIDDPLGAGGNGGSGGSPNGVVATSVGPTTTTTTGPSTNCGPAPDDCAEACTALWCCTQQGDLCPGFEDDDEQSFIGECTEACQDTPALLAIVDPSDCRSTIETISQLNREFGEECE